MVPAGKATQRAIVLRSSSELSQKLSAEGYAEEKIDAALKSKISDF